MTIMRPALAGAILLSVMAPAAVSAGPPLGIVFTVDCTDGSTFDVNLGPLGNAGTAIHIVGDNGILTSNGYAVTIDGVTFEFAPRGLPALDQRGDAVTCVGSLSFDDESGHHTREWVITGWVTPRA